MSGFNPNEIPTSSSPSPSSPTNPTNEGGGDWRKARPGCASKMEYILENKQFTDVTFLVGTPPRQETMYAHKLVLTMYSQVFEAMFQGPWSTRPGEVIEIPDIDPAAFEALLKFIYTGQFDRELPFDVGVAVLNAAHKYDVGDLELVCREYLKAVVDKHNAVTILQAAQLFDMTDIENEAYFYIAKHFDDICITDDFLDMRADNLFKFLSDDITEGNELGMFHGVVRWAKAECVRRGLDTIPANLKSVGNDAIQLLRLPLIPSEDIALQVIPSGLLTPEESTLLLQHMVVSHELRHLLPQLPFSSKKRRSSYYIAKFYDTISSSPYVDISAGWFNKFSVDQPIHIVSFGFYGPHSVDSAFYKVTIKIITDSSEDVLGEASEESVEGQMKEIFHVKFPEPIVISPGRMYRAWFSVKGPLTCHGTTTKSLQEVKVPVNYCTYDHVKFTYNVTGAHQLPEIGFQT